MAINSGNKQMHLARIAAGLTRGDLAGRIGRSIRFVQRVELGDGYAKLTPKTKVEIASILEVPTEVLFPAQGEGK